MYLLPPFLSPAVPRRQEARNLVYASYLRSVQRRCCDFLQRHKLDGKEKTANAKLQKPAPPAKSSVAASSSPNARLYENESERLRAARVKCSLECLRNFGLQGMNGMNQLKSA